MSRLTVGNIRSMLKDYPDSEVVYFSIDEDTCEDLKDDYRYEPDVHFILEGDADSPDRQLTAIVGRNYIR